MNKSELVKQVAEKTEMTQANVQKVLDAVINEIGSQLASGEKVSLAGFGTFDVVTRAARMGVNPKSGAKIQIAESRSPKFKPFAQFKDSV